MSNQVSSASSEESRRRCEDIGLTGRYMKLVYRCLMDHGPGYVDPSEDPDDRRKDGWLTQNQVFRLLRQHGLIGDVVQVSSINPRFAQMMRAGHLIQMDEVPGDTEGHKHKRRDEITGGWDTLWKIAPPETVPTPKVSRPFFIVDADNQTVRGPYTRAEYLTKMADAGERRWTPVKVSGSRRYKLELV